MNLYQLYFTRTGRQQLDAGWKITAESPGTSRIAEDTFKGIASNLIGMRDEMPEYVLDMRSVKGFAFFSGVNYNAKGEDSRGNVFVHGYAMNMADYYELCQKPEMFLGTGDDCFQRENTCLQGELPVLHAFSYEELSVRGLLQKYGISVHDYVFLLKQAVLAVMDPGMPLQIRIPEGAEKPEELCKEVLYLIYAGLPWHLRIRISFFSASRKGCTVCFSTAAEGENIFDLNTGTGRAPERRLPEELFWEEYLRLFESGELEQVFREMAYFQDRTYGYASTDPGACQITTAYLYARTHKTEKNAVDFLRKGFTEQVRNYELIDISAAEYLGMVNSRNADIADSILERGIVKRFQKTGNPELKNAYCVYYAKKLKRHPNPEKYEEIYAISQKLEKEYSIICDTLRKENSAFYQEYYEKYYAPRHFVSYGSIREAFRKPDQGIPWKRNFMILQEQLDKLLSSRLENCGGNAALEKEVCEVKGIIEESDRFSEKERRSWENKLEQLYWKWFRVSEFRFDDISSYKKFRPEMWAEKSEAAMLVSRMQGLKRKIEENSAGQMFCRLFFEDRWDGKEELRESLLKELRDYLEEMLLMDRIPEFDILLGAYYCFEEHIFRIADWAEQLVKMRVDDYINPQYIDQNVAGSFLMQNESLKNDFIAGLRKTATEIKKEKSEWKRKKDVQQCIFAYAECLGVVDVPQKVWEIEEWQYRLMLTGSVVTAAAGAAQMIAWESVFLAAVGLLIAAALVGCVCAVRLIFRQRMKSEGENRFAERCFFKISRLVQAVLLFGVMITVVLLVGEPFLTAVMLVTDGLFMCILTAGYVLSEMGRMNHRVNGHPEKRTDIEIMQSENTSMENISMIRDTMKIMEKGYYMLNGRKVNLKLSRSQMEQSAVYFPEDLRAVSVSKSTTHMYGNRQTQFGCKNMDSFSLARMLRMDCAFFLSGQKEKRVLVLNMADPMNLGDGVYRGEKSQEGDLCRRSSLLVSLESPSSIPYFEYNRRFPVHVGSDAVIITPDVEIIRDEQGELLEESVIVSVMSCAAPHLIGGMKEKPQKNYQKMFYRRIEGMLKIAAYLGYRVLVLGAFGCGTSGNDARFVSDLFHKVLKEFKYDGMEAEDFFYRIEFAVQDCSEKCYNFNEFSRKFNHLNYDKNRRS